MNTTKQPTGGSPEQLLQDQILELVRARLMVDRMVQQIEGPAADDGVH